MDIEELKIKDKEIRDKILELRLKLEYFRNDKEKNKQIETEINILNREWRTVRSKIAEYNNEIKERGMKL